MALEKFGKSLQICKPWQRVVQWSENTHFLKGSITAWLTSGLTGLDSAALLGFNQQKRFTCLAKSQPVKQDSDTSPYKVGVL